MTRLDEIIKEARTLQVPHPETLDIRLERKLDQTLDLIVRLAEEIKR